MLTRCVLNCLPPSCPTRSVLLYAITPHSLVSNINLGGREALLSYSGCTPGPSPYYPFLSHVHVNLCVTFLVLPLIRLQCNSALNYLLVIEYFVL